MGKGLAGKFITYGIRQDDLMLISTLSDKHQVVLSDAIVDKLSIKSLSHSVLLFFIVGRIETIPIYDVGSVFYLQR